MIFLYIFVAIIVLILLILLFKIKVQLDFVLDGTSFEWNGTLAMFAGAVKINLHRPVDKGQEKVIKKPDKKIDLDKPEKSVDFMQDMLENIRIIMRYFKRKLTIEEFRTQMKIGLNDPMYTALLYGSFWTFAGFLYEFVQGNIRMKDMEDVYAFELQPDFDAARLYIKHNSAYSIRPLQILFTAIDLLVHEKPIRSLIFK